MSIPFYSMDLSFNEIASILKAISSGQVFRGEAIKEYENLILSRLRVKHIILFPSARTGFFFLINNLFKAGDEVIVSICTFPLFVRLMHEKGIKPVFVDVEPQNVLINASLIEEKITSKTKGILVTHLFGNPCEMDKISQICKKYNLYLLEDCAHAFDSRFKGQAVGTFGTAGIFSTSPMKIPTTLGGGFITTNDENVYKRLTDALYSCKEYIYRYDKFLKLITFSSIYYFNSFPYIFSIVTSRLLRFVKAKNPGMLRKLFYSEIVSKKSFDPFERIKFSNLQAVVGISQIIRHNQMIQKRRHYAEILDSCFKDCEFIKPIIESANGFNNYLYYVIRISDIDAEDFIDNAMRRGLYLMPEDVWYCNPYSFSQMYHSDCPVAEKLKSLLIRLPNSSLLSEREIYRVAEVAHQVVKREKNR